MPDELKIRERAYALWEEGGRIDGNHDEHWHQAVRELSENEPSEDSNLTRDEGLAARLQSAGVIPGGSLGEGMGNVENDKGPPGNAASGNPDGAQK